VRLLANENFPGLAVQALRSRGHDVFWVRTDAPGISDRQVLERAAPDHRLLITFEPVRQRVASGKGESVDGRDDIVADRGPAEVVCVAGAGRPMPAGR